MAFSIRRPLALSPNVGRRTPQRIAVLMLAGVALAAVSLRAADVWVAVESPHVTVISNAGDKQAGRIAWQFEQVRTAIGRILPSAAVPLRRPFVIIAARDESTLKATAPVYWQRAGTARPYTVVAGAPDKQYVALRADVNPDGKAINPYLPAFRNYTYEMLQAAYGARLPFVLREGFSWVFGNAAIADSDLQVGRINAPLRTTFLREPRLHLADLIALTPASPYVSDPSTRGRFDAQSWALAQHLLLGDGSDGPKRVAQLVGLLADGTAADAAFRQVYGSLEMVERREFDDINGGRSQVLRLSVDTKVVTAEYPVRRLTDVDADLARAAFQLASGSPVEAVQLLASVKSRDDKAPALHELEGLAADRERNFDAAQRAYKQAADLGSTNFYVYVRLAAAATGKASAQPEAEKLLGKAIELNEVYAPSLQMLASLMLAQNRPANALGLARRAVQLDPDSFSYHLLLARILQRNNQPELAQTVARETLVLARTDQERQLVQPLLSRSVTAATGGGLTLNVTDTSGVSTSISAPSIVYTSRTSNAVVTERAGMQIYQGQGQVVVNWSQIEAVALSGGGSGGPPPHITGRLTLAGGQATDRDFVAPGRLTGQSDTGAFSIALKDIAVISVAKAGR
jgi:tetratricopeptide (TPR) repeat protein